MLGAHLSLSIVPIKSSKLHTKVEYQDSLAGTFWHKFAWFKETVQSSHNLPLNISLYLYIFVYVCVCVCVRARLFLWSSTLHSVCCGPIHLHPSGRWHPAHLLLHSPPWGQEQPAGLSHLQGASISLSPSPQDPKNILCWLGWSFTALHLCLLRLQAPLFSILKVMCWLRLPAGAFFPWHDLSAL